MSSQLRLVRRRRDAPPVQFCCDGRAVADFKLELGEQSRTRDVPRWIRSVLSVPAALLSQAERANEYI